MVVVWRLMELSIFVRLIVSLYSRPATSDAITHLGAIMMLAPGWSSSPVLCRGIAQNPPQSTPSSSWSWISLLHSPAAEGRLAVLPQLASAAADMAKERRNSEMIIAKETSNPAF